MMKAILLTITSIITLMFIDRILLIIVWYWYDDDYNAKDCLISNGFQDTMMKRP